MPTTPSKLRTADAFTKSHLVTTHAWSTTATRQWRCASRPPLHHARRCGRDWDKATTRRRLPWDHKFSLPDSQLILVSPSSLPVRNVRQLLRRQCRARLGRGHSNTEDWILRRCSFVAKLVCVGYVLTAACNGWLTRMSSVWSVWTKTGTRRASIPNLAHTQVRHAIPPISLPSTLPPSPPVPPPPPPPPRFDCRALAVRKDTESTCIPHKKHAPRRDHMKTHGVKLPNRGHNSAPVIRSRAGLGGVTTSFSLLSQPNVGHHHLSHVFERVSHVLNFLQHVGVSCPRISTYLTLPCHGLRQCYCVSKLRQVHTPLGRLFMFPARLHLFIYFLVFFTSNSATFIRHFPHFACVFLCSASFLLFPSCLLSPSVVSRFSFSRLHFSHISTRPPPNEATPILD